MLRGALRGAAQRVDLSRQKSKDTEVELDYVMKVGRELMITAGDRIVLNCGPSQIELLSNGTINVNGKTMAISMDKLTRILADIVKIN